MIKVLIACTFWIFSVTQQGARTYEIASGIDNFTLEFEKIINQTNWDKYRTQTKRRVLKFENGFSISLYSSKELENLNIPYNKNVILLDDDVTEYQPVYKINEAGYILELHSYKLK